MEAVLSELDSIFPLKEREIMTLKLSSVENMLLLFFQLALARVELNAVVHRSLQEWQHKSNAAPRTDRRPRAGTIWLYWQRKI